MSLKRFSGTLNVSSMNTTFLTPPMARIESSSRSTAATLASVSLPARVG